MRIVKKGILTIFLILQGCHEVTQVDTICNGTGTITYSTSTYIGECQNGKKEGQGILTFNSGGKYDGEWHNDVRNGKGTYYYENGEKYDGEWKNGEKDGKGTYDYENGNRYEGEWKNGKKEGQGILTFNSGGKYDGEWKNGEKDGTINYITQYGISSEIWVEGNLTEVTNQNSYEEAYSYFNSIRKQANMVELEPNGILEDAAKSHSNYITLHDDELEGLAYHTEEKGKEGFTGITSSERAIYQGYFSTYTGEGISHQETAKESINSLMTAIYHRFGILTFDQNEVGVGFTQNNRELTRNFVHETGNSNLNNLCQSNNYISGTYYNEVCANSEHKIELDDYEEAKNSVKRLNPKYVLWPSANSVNNLYKFSGEIPDPMPDYNETGNPISIQFNEYYYPNAITMQSFKLFKDKIEIKETRILTKETDPNKRFSEYQYALFPLNILEKDTSYRVSFSYKYNNVIKTIEWSFTTMKE